MEDYLRLTRRARGVFDRLFYGEEPDDLGRMGCPGPDGTRHPFLVLARLPQAAARATFACSSPLRPRCGKARSALRTSAR